MTSSGLRGSYPLTHEGIAENVPGSSPGAYALGHVRDSKYYIQYVGRSDNDVADRLGDHIGRYPRFKFECYGSAKAAFEKECNLYHDFSPRDNSIHPDRPNGTHWKCPRCTIFD